jgi:hypothetical protein
MLGLASLLATSGITRRAHVLLGRITPHTVRKQITDSLLKFKRIYD